MTRTIPEPPEGGWTEEHINTFVTIITDMGTRLEGVPIIPFASPFGGVCIGPALDAGRMIAQAGMAMEAMMQADAALMQDIDDDDEDEQGGGLFVV